MRYGSFTSVWVSAGNVRYSSDSDRIIDARQAAATAWKRFVAFMKALPADQAQPLWRDVCEQAARATAQRERSFGGHPVVTKG